MREFITKHFTELLLVGLLLTVLTITAVAYFWQYNPAAIYFGAMGNGLLNALLTFARVPQAKPTETEKQ